MLDIEKIKFDEKGLVPAIVVDNKSKKVLTLAYMNKESLKITMEKKLTCFYSRSRKELWLKGETSGNYQHVVSITADCDNDALVVAVEKDGLDEVDKVVENLLASSKEYKEVIENKFENLIFNHGCAAEKGARYILTSLANKKKS